MEIRRVHGDGDGVGPGIVSSAVQQKGVLEFVDEARSDGLQEPLHGQRATALLESVELKHFEAENKRLREELEESRAAMCLLEDDVVTLSQALNLKVARVRQIEEERGAVIGELRASLEGMANEHRTMRAQMKEERLLLTDQL